MTIPFKYRQRAAIFILIVATLFAAWSAIPDSPRSDSNNGTREQSTTVSAVSEYNLLDIFDDISWIHVLVHVAVYGTVTFLLAPWGIPPERGSIKHVVLYVLVATIIWETIQATVFTVLNGLENTDFDWDWFSGVVFDFVVNGTTAFVVVTGVWLYQKVTGQSVTEGI